MNNTDRKGGHILPVDGGRHIYGVDHGVASRRSRSCGRCSGAGAGRPLAADELAGLERIRDALDGELGGTSRACCRAPGRGDGRRATRCSTAAGSPTPRPDWPAIPWPPF